MKLASSMRPAAHNKSLQRTAGLRFSQFVAQWPAAAEFLRSTLGVLWRDFPSNPL
jgi:hypothetical protein